MRYFRKLASSIGQALGKARFDRRGAVSIMVAGGMVPMLIAIAVGIDFSRIADGRATLQRAVDNGALSGAAVYSLNAQAAQTRATVEAASAFCETTATLPVGFILTGTASQACGGGTTSGPVVTTQIGGYKTGTLGITASACSATNPIVAGVNCGFIVTVTAQITMNSLIPAFFGVNRTIAATGIAANPFLNIGSAITAKILGSAFNTNSIWIYPLLLDSNGNPDFNTNAGAVPGLTAGVYPADASPSGCTSLTTCGSIGTPAGINCLSVGTCGSSVPSGCTDSPLQFTCGSYTMLADTYYNTTTNPCPASNPCYPNGAGTYPQIIAGVIQNPKAPAAIITATTPLGVAFLSQAGGNQSYGNGGYSGFTPYSGCTYPGNAVYTTVAQVFGNLANNISGGNPAMDWPKISHWFYSSYLANAQAPSLGEILSQYQLLTGTLANGTSVQYNTRIPSIGMVGALGIFVPTLAACAKNNASGNTYDELLTTTYPASGATNASLFITQQAANSGYILPAATGYAGVRYTPTGTPGYQYGALSCQSFGSNQYTFYWNDMGGSQGYGDDLDYNNGSLIVQCSGPDFVVLIG